MQKVRILNTWYEVGSNGSSAAKFVAGQLYDVTPDTERQIALQNGELVEAPD